MKKIRIWINGFSLIQQYIIVVFSALMIFTLFIFGYMETSIDNFTNQQMYSYLHRSQLSYINALEMEANFDDTNVYHFIYNTKKNSYNDVIPDDLLETVWQIDPIISEEYKDGILEDDDKEIIYSVKTFGNNFLVSVVNDEYRNEFKSALASSTVNASIVVVVIIFFLLMIWVYSLIRPLHSIRNYIIDVKNGEEDDMNIHRNDEIGEVAEALVSMNFELMRQKRIREEMIQNISHDLKTPIATIKSYSESIKDGVYPYGTLEKSVDVIIEHANRLEKKVYSLITYNKVGYLEDTIKGDNLLMAPVIAKAIMSCEILRNDVEIHTEEVEGDVRFHGEEEAWRTVIENLLDNGLRYAKSRIDIVLSDNLLEVSNDGELMDRERLQKLFKPYEKGTKGNFGLGLSIIKRVCDTYGYTVVAENKDDGVVFRIYRNLPAKNTK